MWNELLFNPNYGYCIHLKKKSECHNFHQSIYEWIEAGLVKLTFTKLVAIWNIFSEFLKSGNLENLKYFGNLYFHLTWLFRPWNQLSFKGTPLYNCVTVEEKRSVFRDPFFGPAVRLEVNATLIRSVHPTKKGLSHFSFSTSSVFFWILFYTKTIV